MFVSVAGFPPVKAQASIINATFDASEEGFIYVDDPFGTAQPGYAAGQRVAAGGYGGSGGLQVTLGGVDATASSGMSGGWSYTFNLGGGASGVVLSFRYKLEQTATYEYDEYSRVLVKVDGVQYGRGSKDYVDHVGGDGASSQGNSNSYLPTTDWQEHEIYVGDLSAGSHTIVLGGYNNKKNASDESTAVTIDDVIVTSGNAAPVASAAQALADRVDINQFLAFNQGVAQFDDRCRFSGMGCSSTDYSTNYFNALAWVESQLQAMGYTTVRHDFNYNGNTGTNLYATKLGSVTPTQMYMVSAHLDGRGGGDAFNDDGSGVALVMEVARVLSAADVTTDKSVRFIFWDKEEGGLYGSYGYASNNTSAGGRRALQGTLDEPTWLGLIQHDMILYDHGAGSVTTQQSAYADMDVEWRAVTAQESASRALALKWAYVSGLYAPDYPATAYNFSTNTDDTPFQPYVASISVRENRRSLTSGTNAEWINPYYHRTTDVEASYTRDDDGDGRRDDIELGYNTVRTTLGLVAELAGAQIVSANTPPVADPQSVSTAEDTPVGITLTGSDVDNDPLTYSILSGPSHGTLSGTAPNLTYTPAANYNGPDSFTFKVNDGTADSEPATVSITVNRPNNPPSADPQSVTTAEDTPTGITLTGSDADNDPLTFRVTAGPYHGTLSGTPPALTYTPAAGFRGNDGFSFVANDGIVDSAPATVSIAVTPENSPPSAMPQSLTTGEDTPRGVTLTGVDPDGDPMTFVVVVLPSHGILSGLPPALTYTPLANYHGADSFVFVADDGTGTSAPATVSITVLPANDLPMAHPQSVSTPADTPVAVTLNASDVDGDFLTFHVQSGPAHGALSGAAPNLTYAPAAGYGGADSFTFVANDGAANSAPATVSIAVNLVAYDPPFIDDFESDKGWVFDPIGADTATSGRWQRANPQGTDLSGPKQLDVAASESTDLVTGPLAGANADSFDLDGGVTSVRSPFIRLPAGQDITLSFQYYFAHGRDSSPDDYLRVQVVGSSALTVLNVQGSATDADATWTPFQASLDGFAGQTVYLLVEAADWAKKSVVEAGVDDVAVVAGGSGAPLLAASFDGGEDGFAYADDVFRDTAQPTYAGGAYAPLGGLSGGGLQVNLGGLDNSLVRGMSGGWGRIFNLPAQTPVTLSFWYKLTQTPDYDLGEVSQVLVSLDGVLYGQTANDYVAQVSGNGNGGIYETTGWRFHSVNLGPLAAGDHTLVLGAYNNVKGWTNESSELLIDNVLLEVTSAPPVILAADATSPAAELNNPADSMNSIGTTEADSPAGSAGISDVTRPEDATGSAGVTEPDSLAGSANAPGAAVRDDVVDTGTASEPGGGEADQTAYDGQRIFLPLATR